MLIDFHTHFFPRQLAPRVFELLAKRCGIRPDIIADPESMALRLREYALDHGVFLPVVTHPAQQDHVNGFAGEMNGLDQGRLIGFGSVHPASRRIRQEVKRIRDLGLKGIKVHPVSQLTNIDDPGYRQIVQEAADSGLLVLFHGGFDLLDLEHDYAQPERAARLLDQVGETAASRVIIAHLGGYWCWDATERWLVGRPVWLDTAYLAGEVSPEQARRIIRNHGYQRVLFGSDCPWKNMGVQLDFIRGLQLPAAEEAAVLGGNAAGLLGLETPA